MSSDWIETTLGEVVTLQRGIDLPVQDRQVGDVPVVASTGVVGFHNRAPVKGPGVVIGRSGSIGGGQFIRENFWPLNTTLWVKDFHGNDPRYCYYLLRSMDFSSLNAGSGVPTLNRNHLHPLKVLRAPKAEQRRIASTLGDIDDKIDLNRGINQTLEAIAQAIFKSWFVDFDPVKAKIAAKAEARDPLRAAMTAISGKPNAELDTLPPDQFATLAATAALFPEEMEGSELGEMPKGWTIQSMAQLTTKIGSGSTPRGGKEVYLDEGTALIRSQNVYDSLFVWEGLARITDEAAAQLKGVTVREDDVLLNITGASILRTCVVLPDVLPARVNQHVAIIRAKAGVPARFLHQHLLLPETKNHLLGLNAGGSREAVTKAHIESLKLLVPSADLLAAFGALGTPMFKQVESCAQEMRTLAELRDTLLPKLLSGKLSVLHANEEVCDAL